MKKLLNISALGLVALLSFSCSREEDIVNTVTQKDNFVKTVNETDKISFVNTNRLATSARISELNMNQSLLLSHYGIQFNLVMQNDANLVLYRNGIVYWASGTQPFNIYDGYPYNPVFKIQNDRNILPSFL
ncbi:hypothetical protein [Frigoriflavimonas asaccharolytica]|uniref:Bulb-type lectin domain-containing protein n=1 Tax=Frigoriflavimonas asaccharolytica TaxID=2735899 RepID=A0A8J8GBY6_9FLAO|nr:hypothetical protein [Frigoriflavimonas asaccharolytica]NRS93404.1 hypothetical protein [Frigoriflavimonas asaccharolytica]